MSRYFYGENGALDWSLRAVTQKLHVLTLNKAQQSIAILSRSYLFFRKIDGYYPGIYQYLSLVNSLVAVKAI
jgi:hypothetical protein